jgi:hypothetical protein
MLLHALEELFHGVILFCVLHAAAMLLNLLLFNRQCADICACRIQVSGNSGDVAGQIAKLAVAPACVLHLHQ